MSAPDHLHCGPNPVVSWWGLLHERGHSDAGECRLRVRGRESCTCMRDMYLPGSLRCDVVAHIAWWGRMKNMSSSVVMQVDEQRGVLWLSAP